MMGKMMNRNFPMHGIYNQVLGRQSADGLDTVSGATYSSNGLIQAFQSAISQAK